MGFFNFILDFKSTTINSLGLKIFILYMNYNDLPEGNEYVEKINKHEYNIPEIPEVPEDVDEIHRRYTKGDITLVEMQREIEDFMSDT
jgi:hypothetical protein